MAHNIGWVTFEEKASPPAYSAGQLPAAPSTPLATSHPQDVITSPRAADSADHLTQLPEIQSNFNHRHMSAGGTQSQQTFPRPDRAEAQSGLNQFQQDDTGPAVPGVFCVSTEVQTDSLEQTQVSGGSTAANGGARVTEARDFWGDSLPITNLKSCRADESWQGGSMQLSDLQETREIFQPDEKIKDHTWLSIVVCSFFFLPIGLAALSFASEARTCKQEGRYKQAREKSKIAFQVNILGIVMGCIIYVLGITLFLRYRLQ